jgi:hypothetical protein
VQTFQVVTTGAIPLKIERRQQISRQDIEQQRTWLAKRLRLVEEWRAELPERVEVSDSNLVWRSWIPAGDSDDSETVDAPWAPRAPLSVRGLPPTAL